MLLHTFVSELTQEQLMHLHRPRTQVPAGTWVRLVFAHNKHPSRRSLAKHTSGGMRANSELSARSGRVVLLEYVEEQPPILSGLGMASRLRTFRRVGDGSDDDPSSVPRVHDGDVVTLLEDDKFPLMGALEDGQQQQCMMNNLFQAPLFEHSALPTDFLVVRPVRSRRAAAATAHDGSAVEAVLRPIRRIYVVRGGGGGGGGGGLCRRGWSGCVALWL